MVVVLSVGQHLVVAGSIRVCKLYKNGMLF